MGLITETVKVKWCNSNKKHYISLGYEFTKIGNEFEIKVEDLPKGSNVKVKYQCEMCGAFLETTYQSYIKYIKNNCLCRSCKNKVVVPNKRRITKLKNNKSFYDWCIKNKRKDLLELWDFELNNKTPEEVTYGCGDKFWFKCSKHSEHHSELKCIQKITSKNKIQCKQCNSFAQWMIDNNLKIEDYWDYDKNVVNPWDISYSSHKKIWIKCQDIYYHESYTTYCNYFVDGCRCPYCNPKSGKVHPQDSLGQYIINNYGEDFLWKIWSDKNKKSPFEYTPQSMKKVWWKCLDNKHEEYCRDCNNSYTRDFRCPQCSQERKESIIEEKTRLYLEELGYKVLTEYNCTITPKNPKTKHLLPYDNEIILSNGEHLIIEVHGSQHYDIKENSKYISSIETPLEYLHKRKLYDRYKRIYAKCNGYNYLELPYWCFEGKNQEIYKQIINIKLEEILNKN